LNTGLTEGTTDGVKITNRNGKPVGHGRNHTAISLPGDARSRATRKRTPVAVTGDQKRPGRDRLGAFWLYRCCGQGQGRTADLPLFQA
jgi:hypothetical protein